MPKVNLFTCHYKTKDKARQKELDFCFQTNQNHPLITKVFNFDDRPRYSDFFRETTKYPNDINILSNADIYFNQTLSLITGIKKSECYALTRWEENGDTAVPFAEKHRYNRQAKPKHSQDVWIFLGAVRTVPGNFYMGVPGADNAICAQIMRSGYQVTNPSLSIQCIHRHKEEKRNYNIPEGSPEKIPPPYRWVEQTELGATGRNAVYTR